MMRSAELESLPSLDATEAAHSARVRARVEAAIAARGGWLPFDEYMNLVLYAPGLGYYSAGARKFGSGGDFTTAPEISLLFGRCLARAIAPIVAGTGGDVLEFGAGSGRLVATLLPALEELQALPRHYWILEVSAELRDRQAALLATLPAGLRQRVQWLERLPEVPLEGVMLANEVADALPFECFAVRDTGLSVRGVALDAAGRLAWAERPAPPRLRAEFERIQTELDAPLPSGHVSEICPAAGGWITSLAAALGRGVALLIDYGLGRREYYHPSRSAGTLRCHYRHRAHDDPFLHPGLQDITAWVDFTRLAEAAVDSGLEVAGYCTQAAFLLANGIEKDLAHAADTLERARAGHEAGQLLLPGGMGETFKVLALSRGWDEDVSGFELQDLRRLL
jgi:SAM-dependent MidA family methyltransferase